MIKTVVRFHHWLPFDVYRFYLDDRDPLGLVYWYEDVESEIWHSYNDEEKKNYKSKLNLEQLDEHEKRFNPNHIINIDTGEWYLK